MDQHWRYRTSTLQTLREIPFLWGTAVSGHQVDGNNVHSDWWSWEKQPGHIADGTTSGIAVDFWHRWNEDLDQAVAMGTNAFRFSLEWARIVPRPGVVDAAVLEHYRTLIRGCRDRGLEPVVTLWHFSLPSWFADRGGWQSSACLQEWSSYLDAVMPLLRQEHVRFVCPLNEPEIYVHQSYRQGTWPPGRRSWKQAWRVYKTLATAQRMAYARLHADDSWRPIVVLVVNHAWLETTHADGFPAWMERLARSVIRWFTAERFLRWVQGDYDCLGLNYYFRNRIVWRGFRRGWGIQNPNTWTSDLGWDIDPDGLRHLLIDLKRLSRPILVTENGLADAKDATRIRFLKEHLSALHAALDAGTPVVGYLHWSLLDNVEWSHGKTPRFGLIAVDHRTQRRQLRPSSHAYHGMIAGHHVSFLRARDHAILSL